MDEGIAGLIGAAIGAGGAVTAQAISAAFTQRSTRERFEWERQQAQQKSEAEREQRFVVLKRELFASFLAAHSAFRTRLIRTPVTHREDQAEAGALLADWLNHLDRAELLREEIALVAPSLKGQCGDLMLASGVSFSSVLQEEGTTVDREFQPYREAIDLCRARFSEHLAVQP